jgi:hypothetical protein
MQVVTKKRLRVLNDRLVEPDKLINLPDDIAEELLASGSVVKPPDAETKPATKGQR